MAAHTAFYNETVKAAADRDLAKKLYTATYRQYRGRQEADAELGDVDRFRRMAADLRDHVLANLDAYLDTLATNLERRGVGVHFAETAEQAREIICQIARENGVRQIVKGKSMASEEIDLTAALEQAGMQVTETDLGEYIVQLAGSRPSHIVGPAIHFSTGEIAELFREKIGYTGPAEPTAMTKAARNVLRAKFHAAEMGVTGVNFAVADPGLISVCTNEGNARYCTSRRIHVALMGMERLVPDVDGLALMCKLLARFNSGQRITQYTNLIAGPCDRDGAAQVHLVILDGFRSKVLAGKYWKILRCIRCAACVNACPVFRHIGGHPFPGCYSGPVGTVLLPQMLGTENVPDVPKASTLCGLCGQVCSVDIPLQDMIVELRNDVVRAEHSGTMERWMMNLWAWGLRHPAWFRFGQKAARWAMTPLSRSGWVRWLPGMPGKWTSVKDLPMPAKKTFMRQSGKAPP